MNRFYTALLFLFLLPLSSLWAQHTFSIVAVDPVTGEVGSAGATCLTSSDCGGCGGAVIISQLTPGLGAINAQATVCIPNSNANNGNAQIAQGLQASAVLNSLLIFDGCQFGDTSNRQYGIVTLDSSNIPSAVSFTGSSALSYAGHHVGPTYAVQGNILLGPQIIDSMEARFNATSGPLCEKLMAALQGANVPGADSRCLADGISSESSFIRVAKPSDSGTFWLDLVVGATLPGVDPIDSLQTLFDQFKTLNGLPFDSAPAVSIYPNPTSKDFNIDFSRAGGLSSEIAIFNAAGQLVHQVQRTPSQDLLPIRATDLGAPGIYLIRISSPGQLDSTLKLLLR